MHLEKTATRVWKRLSREERLAAAGTFWQEPPQEVVPGALAAIVGARKIRPQVVRTLSAEARTAHLASVLEPGELVASSLLVALHLGHRREMLRSFLDDLGLPHEDGVIAEDEGAETPPIAADRLSHGRSSLLARWSEHEVDTYLNTLWLQDPDRWGAVEQL